MSPSPRTDSDLSFLHRSVQSRLYQRRDWTLSNREPHEVGAAIASLKPTFVATIYSLKAQTPITPQMVEVYNVVRNEILKQSPDCKFSFQLFATDYETSEDAINKAKQVFSAIPIDIVAYDFLSGQYKINPATWEEVVSGIHSLNKLVTGHIWGARNVPQDLDFISTDDENFGLRQPLMQNLGSFYPSKPIVLETNNNPQNAPNTQCCIFRNQLTVQQRKDYLKNMAQSQQLNNHTFAYPVFFPTCPVGVSHDTLGDSDLLQHIMTLLDQFNLLG